MLDTAHVEVVYHKILMISPGLLFIQKAFLLGLSGELTLYYFREGLIIGEFCVSKLVGLDSKRGFIGHKMFCVVLYHQPAISVIISLPIWSVF